MELGRGNQYLDWKRRGRKKITKFSPQHLENLQNLLPRFSVYKQIELIHAMLFISLVFHKCNNSKQCIKMYYQRKCCSLTVTAKFIQNSTFSNHLKQYLMLSRNSFQKRNVFFTKFQNKISNFLLNLKQDKNK